ncbi:MAG TPA: IgGFc-binding protein, partial [bacterium]|nr:IgGFc-binding protein [bacterium]
MFFHRPIPLRPFLLYLLLTSPLGAAITSQGRDFWVTFPQGNGSSTYPVTLQFIIASSTDNSGSVTIPGLGYSQAFTVAAGSVTQFSVPPTAEAKFSDAVSNLGIHVNAANPIALYGLNQVQYASDGYTGLPVEALGTDYMVGSYKNEIYSGNSLLSTEFSVVATQDCTHVSITPLTTVAGHTGSVAYAVLLQQGEVYQLQGPTVPDDLTGTSISSDRPIAVFGGHICDFVPAGVPSCNHLVEEFWPLPYWGTQFALMNMATRAQDTVRIISASAATTVTVNGSPLIPLQKGWSNDQTATGPLYISSNHPVYVVHFSDGGTQDSGVTAYNADPAMISIPPVSEFDQDYLLPAPVTSFANNYENIVTNHPGSVTLDGTAIAAGFYSPINGGPYYGVQVSVLPGSHHLHSAFPFGAVAYGFDQADAYGYPGGPFFSSNTPVPTDTPGGICNTPTPTNTPTSTPTPTPTNTRTPTFTRTPTNTPTPTRT